MIHDFIYYDENIWKQEYDLLLLQCVAIFFLAATRRVI